MTVEMNHPSASFRPHSSSLRHKNMGAQVHDDVNRRLSDDIYSLSSWSENLSLSTSSSSESVSHPSPRYGEKHRDSKSKIKMKTNAGKAISDGQAHKNKFHSLSKVGKFFSAAGQAREFESTSASSRNFAYKNNEGSVNVPDVGLFGRYEDSDVFNEPCEQFNSTSVNGINRDETSSENQKNTDSVTNNKHHNNVTEPLKSHPQTQRLYPDLQELKDLYAQEDYLATSPSSSSSVLTNAKNKQQPPEPQTRRGTYFNFQNLPNRHSKNIQTHSSGSSAGEHKSSFPPPTSHLSRSDMPRNRVTHLNAASLVGRLHKSQPSIASEPQLKRQPKSSGDLESIRLSFEHSFEPENVKTKVKSVWNNIKYGWAFKGKPSFKCDSPLYILGKCYHKQKDDPSTEIEDQFLRDFVSRIWFTYRSNFYPIPGTKLSTDCGWGCMLRSGQMLIAQCLVTHFLGRDWRLYDKQSETETVYYREIIRWFSDPIDTPSDKTPFCLHHLAKFGRAYKKNPGEWYGPASVAYIFRDAFINARQTVPILSQLCIYVAQDCTVYLDDVTKMCTEKSTSESLSSSSEGEAGASSSFRTTESGKWQRSLIILIPIRLGGEVMNEIYIPCVQGLLSQKNCMGIIGGKPKHSLYFIGWQDDKLIYLDPHLCRDAVDTSVSDFRIETYHCMTPRKLTINKMDPSCTVGFYIKNEKDFMEFVQEVTEFISPANQKGAYPLFIFSEGHLSESAAKQNHPPADKRVRVTHYHVDQNGQRHRTFSGDSEEFVML